MTDEETGLTEADVTINGTPLAFVESMTLRCAVSSMRMSMNTPHSKKVLGQLAANYDFHLRRLEQLLIEGCNAGTKGRHARQSPV